MDFQVKQAPGGKWHIYVYGSGSVGLRIGGSYKNRRSAVSAVRYLLRTAGKKVEVIL